MEEFEKTLNIINILRKNCPSDITRTNLNVINCIKEELDEVKLAIKNSDKENLTEELGDLLFNILFLINIETSQTKKVSEGLGISSKKNSLKDLNNITLERVLDKVNNKMIFRHPHVFKDIKKVTKEEAELIWKEQKKKEKELKIVH